MMEYIEIELDCLMTAKRCPKFRTEEGFVDYQAIRNYFKAFGYCVGSITVI